MDANDVAEVLARPIARQLLNSSIPARLASTGPDGAPRVIPIGFWWDGANLVMATVPKAAKVPALRHNPQIAAHGRWAPTSPVVLGYICAMDRWRDNVMRNVGL
ncbi:pyridoxamine 5'-phosphate oxidase family protein [Herbidospora yilanensis]|uniref:pyridoxamine 5'-phosphate oxidase family protein n=1 Tax=Herbidospora yilanensis TaxID=354426 RepID=UPI000AD6ADAC|nr:pyridoxamine 5'-phosphate oxidase family protein [Herbidospora yilanensis]